jgi:hypothetical protein
LFEGRDFLIPVEERLSQNKNPGEARFSPVIIFFLIPFTKKFSERGSTSGSVLSGKKEFRTRSEKSTDQELL